MTRARDVADNQENLGGGVPPFTAGKNKIINGDFGVWQRGTSFTNPTSAASTLTSDRWKLGYANANPTSASITQQTFTAGTAPVSGYEGTYFARSTITTVGSTTIYRPFTQLIEDVRTLAGQAVTISFWAKADSSRVLTIYWQQNFGTGGSAQIGSSANTVNLTTSWQRFTISTNIDSVVGKTIGTGSNLEIIFQQAAASGSVLDLWGVQVEAGNVATPFTTATGTIQGELAACQRYYYRQGGLQTYQQMGFGFASSASVVYINVPLPVEMRVIPTAVEFSTLRLSDTQTTGAVASITLLSGQSSTTRPTVSATYTGSGATQYRPYQMEANNSTSGYLAFSAEL